MFETILIPIDGSEKSLLAASQGMELASKLGSKVTMFYVAPVLPVDIRSIVSEKVNADSREMLLNAAEKTNTFNIPLKTEMVTGRPAEAICRKAKLEKFDLIIMGSRGLSGVKGYILGSVTSAVTVNAPCPVLIVR